MKVFQTLAEGGQTWTHRVRMVKQVLKTAASLSLLITLCYLIYCISKFDPTVLKGSYYYVKARIYSFSEKEIDVSPEFWEKIVKIRSNRTIPPARLQKVTEPYFRTFLLQGKALCLKGSVIMLSSFGGILFFFLIRGTASKRKQHVSGKKLVSPFILKWQLILTRRASDIRIGSLPLVKGTETQHILLTGGTGSGKTNCFHHILPQIRERGEKALIVDTTGVFIERYYDSSKDIILNPFDERGVPWHPWVECQNVFDYEDLAESFIPQTSYDQENYWRTAARSLFSSLLQKLKDKQSSAELSQWLLIEPLDKLAKFVQGTKAAAHIDISSAKTAASIRSVASSFLKSIEYLDDTSKPFSIREWIKDEGTDSWLFLSCKPSQRAALNPLLSCWFSVGARNLLQLEADLDRRVWFVIDELPTLQKLKALESFVCESRKYGGCGLFALQSPAQLEENYGHAATQTIIGNCATRIIFAEYDPVIADRISKSLGESEIKEYQEGISYGAHEVRDGVNLSLQSRKLPIVSVSDIQALDKNQAFVKLPGSLPVVRLKIDIIRSC